MPQIRSYRELDVWRESMKMVHMVYDLTRCFPSDEKFGLVSQMRRATVSVPTNIAEGAARASRKEFLQFLAIARGSLAELETELQIAAEQGMVARESVVATWQSCEKTYQILNGLIRSLRKAQVKGASQSHA